MNQIDRHKGSSRHQSHSRQDEQIHESEQNIIDTLKPLDNLEKYSVRDLVRQSEKFGEFLKSQGLETNQMRKFLDAVNRIKADLAKDPTKSFAGEIEDSVVLLEPKLAYAAGRKETSRPLKPFSRVISAAIQRTRTKKDFERLVQLIESIIAYHKAKDGK